MAITELHQFGWSKEEDLHDVLEALVEEPLVKSAKRYDTIDFSGENVIVELKCRTAKDKNGNPLLSTTHSSWLVPAIKIDYAERAAKSLYIVYSFEGDGTLWYIKYEKGMFSHLERIYPEWHHSRAPHYYVPADLWTQVEVSYS